MTLKEILIAGKLTISEGGGPTPPTPPTPSTDDVDLKDVAPSTPA